MRKKIYKLFLFFLICYCHAIAQTAGFNYTAEIRPVDSSGFYNIVLTPELNARLKTDYSDLRIVNDSGKWVPHLLRMPNDEQTSHTAIFNRKIIEKENTGLVTKIIIQSNAESISNIILTVKNTAAKRYCTLSGSDDKNAWFVINDSIEAVADKLNENNTSRITLLFPPVSYKFFKVVINNAGKEPLNILNAGTEGETNLPGRLFRFPPIENPPTTILQKDSGKYSYISIEQNAYYHFETIALKTVGAKYFNRFAELYIPMSSTHSIYSPGRLVQTLALSNNSALRFNIPLSNAKVFYIIIHNDDNLPLKLEQVKTLSSYRVATVYLEKSAHYHVYMDKADAALPHYDLTAENIPDKGSLPAATVRQLLPIKLAPTVISSKASTKELIWIVIAIAAIVLGFFTYRLVTDMNKRNTDAT